MDKRKHFLRRIAAIVLAAVLFLSDGTIPGFASSGELMSESGTNKEVTSASEAASSGASSETACTVIVKGYRPLLNDRKRITASYDDSYLLTYSSQGAANRAVWLYNVLSEGAGLGEDTFSIASLTEGNSPASEASGSVTSLESTKPDDGAEAQSSTPNGTSADGSVSSSVSNGKTVGDRFMPEVIERTSEGSEEKEEGASSSSQSFAQSSSSSKGIEKGQEDAAVSPLEAAKELEDAKEAKGSRPVIALIDTGVDEAFVGTGNLLGAYSVIGDEVYDDNGHGTRVMEDILTIYPDAQVISVKALDSRGIGTMESVYAAVKYAMEQDVSIINLSLTTDRITENKAVEALLKEAVEGGIRVVGAAGNNGKDASGYLPGGISEVTVIGALDENNARQGFSNYGDTVDFYVRAEATSDAAAAFTGYLARAMADDKDVRDEDVYTDNRDSIFAWSDIKDNKAASENKDEADTGSTDAEGTSGSDSDIWYWEEPFDKDGDGHLDGEEYYKFEDWLETQLYPAMEAGIKYPKPGEYLPKSAWKAAAKHSNFTAASFDADRSTVKFRLPSSRPQKIIWESYGYQLDQDMVFRVSDFAKLKGVDASQTPFNDPTASKSILGVGYNSAVMQDLDPYINGGSINGTSVSGQITSSGKRNDLYEGGLSRIGFDLTGRLGQLYELCYNYHFVDDAGLVQFVSDGKEDGLPSRSWMQGEVVNHAWGVCADSYGNTRAAGKNAGVVSDPNQTVGQVIFLHNSDGYPGEGTSAANWRVNGQGPFLWWDGFTIWLYPRRFSLTFYDAYTSTTLPAWTRSDQPTGDIWDYGSLTPSHPGYHIDHYVVDSTTMTYDQVVSWLTNNAVDGDHTITVYYAPDTYRNSILVRYQDKDGSWGDWNTAYDQYLPAGTEYSAGPWGDTAVYYKSDAVSYTSTSSAQEHHVDVYRKQYTYTFYGNKPSNASHDVTGVPSAITKYAENTPGNVSGPSLTGWKFAGWNTSSGGGGSGYDANESMLSNKSFYAQWTANTYYVTYYSNGEQNDGDEADEYNNMVVTGDMPRSQYSYDTAGTLRPNTFARKGYDFVGWKSTTSGTGTGAIQSGDSKADGAQVYNWTDTDGQIINLNAQWKKHYGTATLSLVSEETGKPLAGVTVQLMKNNGADKGTVVKEATSGADGKVTFTGLHWFDYKVVSKDVPAGYGKMRNITFSVGRDNCDTDQQLYRVIYMQEHTLTVSSTVNDIINSGIDYRTKEIGKTYLKENAPSFLYHISGTDVAGVEHEYDLMATVDGSSMQGSDGQKVFAGTYTVEVIPVARYNAGTPQAGANAAVSSGTVTLDASEGDADVTYPYTISQYGGLGSVTQKVNHIGL